MNAIFGILSRVEIAFTALIVASVAFASTYLSISFPGGGALASIGLLLLGAAVAVAIPIGVMVARDKLHLVAISRINFWWIVAIGLLLQLVIVLLTKPEQNSDMHNYLYLSERLVKGESYVDEWGNTAFWPVGHPLFLTPFVFIFGANDIAIAVANALLYFVGVISVLSIAQRMFDSRTAIIAALIFTFWPARLLLSGLAAKELLTMALLLAGTALALRCFDKKTSSSLLIRSGLAVGVGFCWGYAALAQPGLMLLFFATPLCYRYALADFSAKRFLGLCLIIIVTASAVLSVWRLRNCEVFSGEFCGVATSGGSNFYRANNPLATGLWTPEGEVPITHMPELQQDKLGFELGERWIISHPLQAAKLSLRKYVYLLGSDSYGAYWSIYRGGVAGPEVKEAISASRNIEFRVAEIVSAIYWVILAGLCVCALLDLRRAPLRMYQAILPLVYSMLYTAAVFSIFESGDRQHLAAGSLLVPLAASAVTAVLKKKDYVEAGP